MQRGGREVFSRLLMNNNQASLFWTRSRSPDFILQRPVRYLHALTYLLMLSPLPASPLVCLWLHGHRPSARKAPKKPRVEEKEAPRAKKKNTYHQI